MKPECQLTVAPFYQCCCVCEYHKAVHYHCCTEPKPTLEEISKAKLTGSCVCSVRKGWACVVPESGVVYDNWGEHSCGCEMFKDIRK